MLNKFDQKSQHLSFAKGGYRCKPLNLILAIFIPIGFYDISSKKL
jgi:hypothetical protein